MQVWSAESGACLRTVEQAGHGLCVMFAPGGRHAVVGTKEGAIDILDVGAATVVETLQAHTSAARQAPAICLLCNQQLTRCWREPSGLLGDGCYENINNIMDVGAATVSSSRLQPCVTGCVHAQVCAGLGLD